MNVLWLVLLNVGVCSGGNCDGYIDTGSIGDDAVNLVGENLYYAFAETDACKLTNTAVWGELPRDEWYNAFLSGCKPAYCTYAHTQSKIDRAMDAFAVVTSVWGILFIVAGLIYGPLNKLLGKKTANSIAPSRAFE